MQWVYPTYLLTSTTGIAQLSENWKRKSFSSLMLLDVFLSVNNWKILTQKVSYEFLVVIMVWRSDLFRILICSALSSLKVNAVHHWSHKALLEDLRAEFVHGYFSFSWVERLWMSFCSEAGLSWLYLLVGGKKTCMLFTCFSRNRPQKMLRAASCLDQSFSHPCACSATLETMSVVHPFSILFLPPAQ